MRIISQNVTNYGIEVSKDTIFRKKLLNDIYLKTLWVLKSVTIIQIFF